MRERKQAKPIKKKLTPQQKRGTDTFGIEPIKRGKLVVQSVPYRPIEWDDQAIEIERLALEKWIKNPKNYFFTGYLNERNLDAKQVERFSQMNRAFCQTLIKAKQIQEQRIVEASLTRKFDGNFAKFVLQNKAGWKEKQEISGDSTNPLALIMDRIAESAKDPLDYDG